MPMSMITEAINIVNDFLEAEGIMSSPSEVRETVEKWHDILSFIENPRELAAISFINPSNRILFSKDEIRTFTSLFFPKELI